MMKAWLRSAVGEIYRQSSLRWFIPPNKVVCHTTEGSNFPGGNVYGGGLRAPHLTIHPRLRQTQQHYPFDRPAYALKAPSGVRTNTAGAIQIEIVGTCEDRHRDKPHSVYSFDEGDLKYLADIFREVSEATGIPLTSTVTWKPYPSSYGLRNGVRLSPQAWYDYKGFLGHQHVPGNSHGDPGDWIPKVLEIANGEARPAPVLEDDEDMWKNLVLVQKRGNAGIYRSNGIIRSIIPNPETLKDIQQRITAAGGNPEVEVVDNIDTFGVIVR